MVNAFSVNDEHLERKQLWHPAQAELYLHSDVAFHGACGLPASQHILQERMIKC
jgi:hypothetical protein